MSLKIDARDLKKVVKTSVRASQEQSRALASAGFALQRSIKDGMKAQHPGGEFWPPAHPWTALGKLRGRTVRRSRRWGRTSYTWTERRRGAVKPLSRGKKPLARLAGAVRYRKYQDGGLGGSVANTKVRVGFLTSRAAKLAAYHATGGTMPVTGKMRRMLFAAGLGIRSGSIKIPRRRHVEPVYERHQSAVSAYVAQRVAAAVAGSGRGPDLNLG